MEHIVFFPMHDGTPAFRRVASLDDAVRLVEHLRNVEQVSDVTLHAMTEVPLAFRAYYKVEVAGVLEGPADPAPDLALDEPVVEEAPYAPVDEVPLDDELPPLVTVAQAGPGVRNGAASDVRGMGFFAS